MVEAEASEPRPPDLLEPRDAPAMVASALAAGVPKSVLRVATMVARAQRCPGHTASFDAVEFFAGQRRICKALRLHGLSAVPFDKFTIDNRMDLESSQGFSLALAILLSVKPGGLVWLAPVCSSWVFINRSTSMRSPLLPTGNTALPHVQRGNLQAARCAALIWLAEFLGLAWVVEQPKTSLLHHSDRFAELLGKIPCHRTAAVLGAFKAATLKPLWLLSNKAWTKELGKPRVPKNHHFTNCTYIKKHGRVTGIPKTLKMSQTYTRRFGRAVAALHVQHLREHQDPEGQGHLFAHTHGLLRMQHEDDFWQDAKLPEVEEYLRGH